jgi:hypothetical protein
MAGEKGGGGRARLDDFLLGIDGVPESRPLPDDAASTMSYVPGRTGYELVRRGRRLFHLGASYYDTACFEVVFWDASPMLDKVAAERPLSRLRGQ